MEAFVIGFIGGVCGALVAIGVITIIWIVGAMRH